MIQLPRPMSSQEKPLPQEKSDTSLLESKWVPILSSSGNLASRAREAIDAIAEVLVTGNFAPGERTAPRRSAYFEEALLFGYMAAAYPDGGWTERAVDCLNLGIDKADETAGYLGLHGGLCGLGWTVEHLSELLPEIPPSGEIGPASEQPSSEDEDLTADINAALLHHLQRNKSESIYDLISGLVGFGVYFLERWPNPAAIQGINAVFNRLEELAQHTQEGITWHTGAEQLPEWQLQQCPNGYYNLGVAHGVPGVIHLLMQISATTVIDPQRLKQLLEGAVSWVLAQQRPPGSRSRFPSWVGLGIESSDSRLGWCYGDLGILAVLRQVKRVTGRKDWEKFADDLLDHCLAWPPDQGHVADAPLCHGATGVAHIFNRIYQSEGDPRCRDIAEQWLERALAMRQPGAGIGGFSTLTRPNLQGPSVWEASPAFLDGAIGVALALIAATTPVEPKWDRLLLLSRRPLDPNSRI